MPAQCIFECTAATAKYTLLDNIVELLEMASNDESCEVDVEGYIQQTAFIARLYHLAPPTVNYAEGGLLLSASNEERLYFK